MVLRMEQSVELQRENFRLRDPTAGDAGPSGAQREGGVASARRDQAAEARFQRGPERQRGRELHRSSPQQFVYSPSVLSELLMNMGFEENMAKQVTVQIELEYQR